MVASVKIIDKNNNKAGPSARAKDMLDNWDDFLNKFLKILPEDYERVLNALKRAEDRGLQGDDAIQAAFEENVAAGH